MDPTLSRSAARRVAWDAMEVANPVAPAAGVVIEMSGGAGKGAPGVRGVLHDICCACGTKLVSRYLVHPETREKSGSIRTLEGRLLIALQHSDFLFLHASVQFWLLLLDA